MYFMKDINRVRIIAWCVFVLFAQFVLDRLSAVYSIIIGKTVLNYRTFDISDWLINYEGGFIRRGILGQLLWEFEKLHLYDVRIAITLICFITSITVLLIIIRIFKDEGWSMLILPTGFAMGFTLFNLGGRRDMLSLLLTFLIFFLFKKVYKRSEGKIVWWLIFYVVSILQLLIHEASFFYTFPILIILYYFKNRNTQLSICRNWGSCLLHFTPVFLTMTIVCIFNGDTNTAEIIWTSWGKVFSHFPCNSDTTIIGEGVDALTWGTQETFANHLKAAYIGSHSPSYWRIPLVLFNIFASYLLVSRINAVDMGLYRKKQMDHVSMSNVLLIQFASMIPMFTVLSCDWGRTIPYWLFSSLFVYHIFKTEKTEAFCYLSKISHNLQNYISSNKILCSNYTYILLVLLCPISGACAPFDFANTFQQGIYTIFKSRIIDIFTL